MKVPLDGASIVAPLDFLRLPFTAAAGFFLFAEILARCTAAGGDRTNIGYNIAMQDRLIVEPRGAVSTKPCLAATIARLQGHQSRRPRLPSQ